MSGDKDKIYADASQPATLIDGDNSIDCPTLGEAVIALDHLPADRQIAARIKVGDRVFTAAEIDRLHHRKAASKDWLGRFKAPLRRLIKDPSIGLNRWEEADRHISDYLRPFKAADWQGAARQWLAGSMMRPRRTRTRASGGMG